MLESALWEAIVSTPGVLDALLNVFSGVK